MTTLRINVIETVWNPQCAMESRDVFHDIKKNYCRTRTDADDFFYCRLSNVMTIYFGLFEQT